MKTASYPAIYTAAVSELFEQDCMTTCENCCDSWAPDELSQEDSDCIFENGWCAKCNRRDGY